MSTRQTWKTIESDMSQFVLGLFYIVLHLVLLAGIIEMIDSMPQLCHNDANFDISCYDIKRNNWWMSSDEDNSLPCENDI